MNVQFRGKRLDNGEWVEGFYYEKAAPLQCIGEQEEGQSFIIFSGFADWNMPRPMYQVEVDAKTVAQFTGVTDYDGEKIYKNDIVERESMAPGGVKFVGEVIFEEGAYWLKNSTGETISLFTEIDKLRILGNIHDGIESNN